MAQYQGHRSRNAWNVALWIYNDEPTYRAAVECRKRCKTPGTAARALMSRLPEKTPDGARFNITCVREAISDILE